MKINNQKRVESNQGKVKTLEKTIMEVKNILI